MGMQAAGSSGSPMGGGSSGPAPSGLAGGVAEYSPFSRTFMQNTAAGLFGQKPQQSPQMVGGAIPGIAGSTMPAQQPPQQAQPMPMPIGVMPQSAAGAAGINPFNRPGAAGGASPLKAIPGK